MKLILLSAVATMLFASSAAHAEPQPIAGKITVVLVHGAFAESSSWNSVIPKLLAKNYDVIAVANPLRSLRTDSEYVATVLDSINGPIVLVGHSYGGSVITGAAFGKGNVKALVYIDGTAPEVGESASDLSGKFPGGTLGPALAPPVPLSDGNKDLYIQKDKYHAQFAADVPEADAKLMYATQRPVTEAALNEPATSAAWKSIPSWFIYGSHDLNIPPAAHAFMAKRAGAKEVVEINGASHVVMISHPDEVAQMIDRAAKAPSPERAAVDVPASAAFASDSPQPARSQFLPAPVVPLTAQPAAQLIVDAPLAAQLGRGYVVIRYRVENTRIMPVYGEHALDILPRIGHLHVTVDDLPWHWLDSSGEPISINGLRPGPHKVLIELENPVHKVIDSKSIAFEIPSAG